MLNEPVGSEHRQLSPLFESVAKVIRKNDKEAILFLCPMYLLGNVRPDPLSCLFHHNMSAFKTWNGCVLGRPI
jgi:hypothetical protein